MKSQSPQAVPPPPFRAVVTAAAVLAGIAIFTFLPALDCDFVNLDDPDYVYQNAHVTAGLNGETIRWAFTDYKTFYWHPLTWLSLQLDATLWRKADGHPDPRGFHLTNVLVHAANTVLVFLTLRALTGAYWRSAAVALFFAVHPLRVESVAWIAERKDVLSAGFGLWAVWAYAAYVRRPSLARYAAIAIAFTMSLLCKPTLVTLPFLFLVLDWWPQRRIQAPEARWWRLVAEKLPLLALVIVSAIVTYVGQSRANAVMTLETFPLLPRLEHVAISYVAYLSMTVWPAGLAVYYPHPTNDYGGLGVSHWHALASILLLAAITAGTILARRRSPYLLAGWLWYLGTLVPVIGLVQVGTHAYADRFTYFPQIGILLGVCWGAADLGRAWPRFTLAAAVSVAALLIGVSREQLDVWHDSESLWDHDLQVANASPVAMSNLLLLPGKHEKATQLLREACRRNPNYAEPRTQLGELLLRQRRFDEAVQLQKEAVALNPRLIGAWTNLGLAEGARRHLDLAEEAFRKALEIQPDFPSALTGLGDVLISQNRVEEGIAKLRAAVNANPRFGEGHYHLGLALQRQKNWAEAAEQLELAIRYSPPTPSIWYSLGNVLREQGHAAEAADCFKEAARLDPNFAAKQRSLPDVKQHRDPSAGG
jgi:protein O-mannosyl-transferase